MTARLRSLAGRLSPLTVRVLSGVLLVAVVVGLIATGRAGVYLLVAVVGGIALWEFRGLSARIGYRAPGWLVYPLGYALIFSGTLLAGIPLQAVLAVALVGGLSGFLVLPGGTQALGRWAMALAGAVYVGVPLGYSLMLYDTARRGPGWAWLLVIVAAVAVSDAAALLVGRRLGRHPFFPWISPKKTVEGAVAGLVCCVPVMWLGGVLLLGLAPWHAAALGVLAGVAAQVGDLVESQMKRLAGVKDSSNLIPGHGGILDRLDSLLFPLAVVFLYTSYLDLL